MSRINHLSRALLTRPATRLSTNTPAIGGVHGSRGYARKDDQDRESMNTESTEYSKSGGDGQAAMDDTAFSRDKTRPEEQRKSAKKETPGKGSPLEASPANQEINKGEGGKKAGE